MNEQELANLSRARGLAQALTTVTQLPKVRMKGIEEIGQEIADLIAPSLPNVPEPGCDEA